MTNFETAITQCADAVTAKLDQLLSLDEEVPEARLVEAMRYSTLGGGKRIRPFLVMSSADLFNVGRIPALRVAAAIEMVHSYSLVHDDLPAMDDDDLRRGQPTCHVKFGEATAILAGDALLTKAFEVLGHPDTHSDPAVRSDLVLELAQAAGDRGMVGGQMMDLMAEHKPLKMPEVARLQRMKTGMLIDFSCVAGAILGKAPDSVRQNLHAYAHDLGLAFQIADDLLDIEGSAEEVGKATGKDEAAGKATFVSLLGPHQARARAEMLVEQAIRHLEIFEEKADLLRDLARFVIRRRV